MQNFTFNVQLSSAVTKNVLITDCRFIAKMHASNESSAVFF